MRDLFLVILRLLALISFIGFVVVGGLFAMVPEKFNSGTGVNAGSAIWHSLSLAFMATVSMLALMIAWNPKQYWPLLLPLAIGKATSSITSYYWHHIYVAEGFLKTNSVTDGLIAIISLLLYLESRRRVKLWV